MITQEDDKKDSLNLLIYEYLLKNNFEKTANAFKEELNITDLKLNDSAPSLSTWYNAFLETAEVRSGQKFIPDSLNRIEGIMLKLENDKQRYSRMKSISHIRGSPSARSPSAMRKPFDPRMPQSSIYDKCDPYLAGHPSVHHSHHPAIQGVCNTPSGKHHVSPLPQTVLVEMKKIDLGLSSILLSCFCFMNSILIIYSSDNRVYFYNLATNEIEYDFPIQRRIMKVLKMKEVGSVIYFAYSCDEYFINLCKYESMKKEDIKTFEFESAIKGFCLNGEYLHVLDDIVIKTFTFVGVRVGIVKVPGIISIEWLGNNLMIIDSNKIAEYDTRANSETNIIARGVYPQLKIKGDIGFIILNDSIQAIDAKAGTIIASVKCTLPYKDLAIFQNTIAVSTSSDLFYASDVHPIKNPIEISQFNCLNSRGLLVVSSDGIVTLYSKIQPYE